MNLRLVSALLILMVLSAVADSAGSPEPVGEEIQVNTYTTGSQALPAVAISDEGDFVVVWQSEGSGGSDSSDRSIQGQRFNSEGARIGDQFQVNTHTSFRQDQPDVAMGPDGEFLVVWASPGVDFSLESVQGQRFDSAGKPFGIEFQINTYTTLGQYGPAVAFAEDGSFVVAWHSWSSSGSDINLTSVQARRFDSMGIPVESEFQVNTYTPSYQSYPDVAIEADGDFVIVWTSTSADNDEFGSVQGQRFDSTGAPVGDQFQVNTYITDVQRSPSVATGLDGRFVVVWESEGSFGSDSSDLSVQGRWFDSTGTASGNEFQINTYTTEAQRSPVVVKDVGGHFTVVWTSYGSSDSDPSPSSIQGQRFDSAGLRIGGEFQVNSYVTASQAIPAVAGAADGDFVVVWMSDGSGGSDSSDFSIQAQRFASFLFADGFESGDVSRWELP